MEEAPMSNPKWLRDFGLSGSPFSKDLDDADLWLPESRIEVVDTLVESLENHEHAVVVGESGVGKPVMPIPPCSVRLGSLHFRQ